MSAKYNLIERTAKKLDVSYGDAQRVVNAVIDAIADTLRDGENVSISNFGTFRVVKLDERLVRNPSNGELVHRDPSSAVRFKVSPSLNPFVSGQSSRATLSTKLPKGTVK